MLNRCPICGRKTADRYCERCYGKYFIGKGIDFVENPCPDMEVVKVDTDYGSHKHTWSQSDEVLEIYWKKVEGRVILSFTPVISFVEGTTERLVIA